MPSKKFYPLVAAGLGAGMAAGFAAYAHLINHRSAMAELCDAYVASTGQKLALTDKSLFQRSVERHREANQREYHVTHKLRCLHFEEKRGAVKTYHLGLTGSNTRAVLYLHGGAFLRQITNQQWSFVDKISWYTGAEVVVPLYPLAPDHVYLDAYDAILPVYRDLLNRYGADAITLLGDSAGGGLAAGFAEWLAQLGMDQPGHTVLVSPLLDLTFSNPEIDKYRQSDRALGVNGLREAGRLWAGEAAADSQQDYRISPLMGDVSQLRNVTVFVGGREILYPDVEAFCIKLRDEGALDRMVLDENQGHDWPLFPTPEARHALRQICRIVNGRTQE
ncbi:MAG: alpha/beta hydrolase [Coriobacteriales bacterium]|nr:alpha/beta hydrolase [Coriobacteriales bacterium]